MFNIDIACRLKSTYLHQRNAFPVNQKTPCCNICKSFKYYDRFVSQPIRQQKYSHEDTQIGICPNWINIIIRLQCFYLDIKWQIKDLPILI